VGASFTAVNLATALARRRRTVLIPAGDITEGTVAGWLGVSTERQDLVQLTRPGTVSRIESALCKTPVSNLCLLPVAPSERWEQMEEALAAPTIRLLLEAGWTVVVDCPPATASTAVFELARLDPVIGVVVGGRTTADELAAAVDRLPGDRSQMTVLVDEGRHGPRQHRPAVPTKTVPTKTVPKARS
jgi:Mrp family chromosome partitioning ATPase